MANLICINLAGVLTFFIQGIRPLSWRDANRAKKLTFRAIISWVLLLAALIIVIFLSEV